ncbi:MAG: ATP-grasp fold amidoligase family protein [Clostridia bacterium]|nr:ATP-grasp fold amidoligase family protein [Clostridia bacterium]
MAQTVTEKIGFWRTRIWLFNKMCGMARHNMLNWVPDKTFIKLQYYLKLGRRLNLEKPALYNEKLQWIKLYDRKPIYNKFVDKIAVRDYVARTVGKKYLVPMICTCDSEDDIPWDELPRKYVLKCSHGSSCNIIQDGKKSESVIMRERARLPEWMKRNWYWFSREWPYKDVKPRILIEQYLEGPSGDVPYDYKILCFDGKPVYIIVDVDRYSDHKRNFYDVNWVRQDMFNRHPGYDGDIPRPERLDEMLDVAAKLSKGIRHIRIDLYDVEGKIYFGEMTFFHGYGMEVFRPREFERKLGDLISLNGGKKN